MEDTILQTSTALHQFRIHKSDIFRRFILISFDYQTIPVNLQVLCKASFHSLDNPTDSGGNICHKRGESMTSSARSEVKERSAPKAQILLFASPEVPFSAI
ncbi:Hypothetical predicted protein [Octopus vulgaris]|uniref:Uncharacterized protein n=1 Tax=Octopus vulgaris TaxID=6645 RepID=A0AA36F0P0_OCTVU|nr:Hypothetical predicted protein [Octopus vulgaris]